MSTEKLLQEAKIKFEEADTKWYQAYTTELKEYLIECLDSDLDFEIYTNDIQPAKEFFYVTFNKNNLSCYFKVKIVEDSLKFEITEDSRQLNYSEFCNKIELLKSIEEIFSNIQIPLLRKIMNELEKLGTEKTQLKKKYTQTEQAYYKKKNQLIQKGIDLYFKPEGKEFALERLELELGNSSMEVMNNVRFKFLSYYIEEKYFILETTEVYAERNRYDEIKYKINDQRASKKKVIERLSTIFMVNNSEMTSPTDVIYAGLLDYDGYIGRSIRIPLEELTGKIKNLAIAEEF